jgi:hypothetical protein
LSVDFVCTGLGLCFCKGYLIPIFVLIGVGGFMGLRGNRGGGIHGPTGDCICIFVNIDDTHDIYIYIYIYIYGYILAHSCLYVLCFYV